MLLRQLYTYNSLRNTDSGIRFSVKNRLTDVKFSELSSIAVNGVEIPKQNIRLVLADGKELSAVDVTDESPIEFPLRAVMDICAETANLDHGKHKIKIGVKAKGYGSLKFEVEDSIAETESLEVRIPRDDADDYGEKVIAERQAFVEEYSGAKIEHIRRYSFDPHTLDGNVENFTGVAQIPIGFAGPIKINGEFAEGEFLICLLYTSDAADDRYKV